MMNLPSELFELFGGGSETVLVTVCLAVLLYGAYSIYKR